MSAVDLLQELGRRGLKLSAAGTGIRVEPSSRLTDELRSLIRANKSELLAAISQKTDPEEISDHWLIIQPAQRSERWFSPPQSRAEIAQRYPGAALVAIPHHPRSGGNRVHEDELRCLIKVLAARRRFTEAEHAEALASALQHPDEALATFRALACESGILEERSADRVRLWITLEDGQQAAIDILAKNYDGLAILELLERHIAAKTTRVVSVESQVKETPTPARYP